MFESVLTTFQATGQATVLLSWLKTDKQNQSTFSGQMSGRKRRGACTRFLRKFHVENPNDRCYFFVVKKSRTTATATHIHLCLFDHGIITCHGIRIKCHVMHAKPWPFDSNAMVWHDMACDAMAFEWHAHAIGQIDAISRIDSTMAFKCIRMPFEWRWQSNL